MVIVKARNLEMEMCVPTAEQLKLSMKERQKGIETYTITINALLNYGSCSYTNVVFIFEIWRHADWADFFYF